MNTQSISFQHLKQIDSPFWVADAPRRKNINNLSMKREENGTVKTQYNKEADNKVQA